MKKLFLFFLGFAFVVRLYKIDNPVADWHSWRQADTASVSRIYMEQGINLLLPKFHDISSAQTGFFNPQGLRMVEFPLYNATHAFLASNFPQASFEIWGRLISIICSLISMCFVYLIFKNLYDELIGLLGTFFFGTLPYNIYYSRVILPEPLAVCLALTSIYFFLRFIKNNQNWTLLVSSLAFGLALLVKPLVFFYGLPILYLAIKKFSFKKLFRANFLIGLVISVLPFLCWRAWIGQFPEGIAHWQWAFNGDSIRFKPSFWRWLFGERIGRLILGIWGVVPASLGFLKSGTLFAQFFFMAGFLYLSVFATANVRHDYYQIYLIPPICLLLALGSVYLWNKADFNFWLRKGFLVFCLVLMFGMSAYQVKEFYKINHPEIIEAGQEVDRMTPKEALIIAPYNKDTAFLYQTKRRGWPEVEGSFRELIEKGAGYFVTVNLESDETSYVRKNFKVLVENEKYLIAQLN